MSIREIWESIKDQVNIGEEEFFEMVHKIMEKAKVDERAAALLVAKRLGIEAVDLVFPPIIGRVLEIGPIRQTRSGAAYRLFSLVNKEELRLCVAFGEEHVNRIGELEDKVVRISRYVVARTTMGELTRLTEASRLEELDDTMLPPIYDLPPAKAPTLRKLKEDRVRIAEATVVMDQRIEQSTCPVCGRVVNLSEDEWVCDVHGPIEPELRTVHRLQVADLTGLYSAVYYGEESNLEDKRLVFKGGFRGDELYIYKVYKIEEISL
ncbi:MAG TPA: hypothetical protein ENF80_03815 [Thermofilum sp.]|nr:hypothetical protein [Thermofilum sp.]